AHGAGSLPDVELLRALAHRGGHAGRRAWAGDRSELEARAGFIEEITSRYEAEIGPMNGAKVVARAWVDPRYKERLLADGTAAIAELGFGGPEGDHMVVVQNTPGIHN